jgi:hypothetical protein
MEWHGVVAQHAISNKVAQLRLAPSSSRGASPDITIRDAEEGSKMRHK